MRRAAAAVSVALLCAGAASADGFRMLKGHGGPIHAIAASGETIATASFDNAVGLWRGAAAPRWLEGHEAAVKAAAMVGDGLVASAGDDRLVMVWDRRSGALLHRMEGHEGAVASLAVSPDGALIASAAWDRRIGLWDARTGARLRWLTGHTGNVNDVAFGTGAAAGLLYSASHDGTVREWRVADGVQTRILARHGFGVNKLLVDRGWLAYGALDGGTRALSLPEGEEIADLTLERRPILAMARSADGGRVAVGDGEGYIMVVETDGWTITRDFRAAKRGPIWALAFVDGGASLAAGGIEDAAYVWPLDDVADAPRMAETARAFHTDPAAVGNGERQFLRKCSICHSLTPDGGRKAGPTLHGLFGRRAGTVAGYSYSDALDGAAIVWEAETIDKLFALGPDHYTPGSKMPMQRIAGQKDRGDLIAFLRERTAIEPKED